MKPTRILVVVLGAVSAFGTALLAQQHSYTQAEIDAGARLYESNCGSCHGETGDKIVGIDFSKGTFKTARSDEDIVRIVRNGVPNTAMPAGPFSEAQAGNLVAFVRSMVGGARTASNVTSSLAGDAARGKTIFETKGNCTSCHAINGAGGTSGPDLGGARGGRGAGAAAAIPAAPGGGRGGAPAPAAPAAAAAGGGGGGGGGRGNAAPDPRQIERSILDPNAEMAAQYRVFQVVTKTNVTTKGTLLNQDTFSVQMRDSNDKLMSYWKQDLREFGFTPSLMPSYRGQLTPQEVADIVSYLVSLRTN